MPTVRVCFLLIVSIVVLPLTTSANPSPFEIEHLRSKRVPMFQLPGIEEEDINLSSFEGRALILFFWASWSPLSKEELSRMYRIFQGTGLPIIAISTDRSIKEAIPFVRTFQGRDLYFGFDAGGRLAKDLFKVFLMPTVFYIDSSGRIEKIYLGLQDWHTEKERLK